ncbi:MAG: hypothetical protein Q9227_004577 [Pyrenula ochraceoflavens]
MVVMSWITQQLAKKTGTKGNVVRSQSCYVKRESSVMVPGSSADPDAPTHGLAQFEMKFSHDFPTPSQELVELKKEMVAKHPDWITSLRFWDWLSTGAILREDIVDNLKRNFDGTMESSVELRSIEYLVWEDNFFIEDMQMQFEQWQRWFDEWNVARTKSEMGLMKSGHERGDRQARK